LRAKSSITREGGSDKKKGGHDPKKQEKRPLSKNFQGRKKQLSKGKTSKIGDSISKKKGESATLRRNVSP